MRTCVHIILLLVLYLPANAIRISGTITDEKGNILPYASVFIKGSSQGTTSNNQGKYFLDLLPGKYAIICQYVGYARQEKQIDISTQSITLDFKLLPQQTLLKEVIVKPGGEDPA